MRTLAALIFGGMILTAGCAPRETGFTPIIDASQVQRITVQNPHPEKPFNSFTFRVKGRLTGKASYTIVQSPQSWSTDSILGEFSRYSTSSGWTAPTVEILYEPAPGASGEVGYAYSFDFVQ